MSSNSDDIQAAGSDTRPPMLDRTDYESWSQRIRLYCRGKENGLQILQSIDQGPFELGTTRDTLGTTPEGGVLLGPERPRTYEDLSDTEKKRYDADVRATNIVLQGLPKDIYKLINHNIEAKAIWDNVKMLLAGSELTKEDRESQLYDEFERFKMLPGENINEYYVRFHKLVNDMRNIRMTMPNIQLNSKFVNNMSPEWDRFVTAVKLNKGLKETNHEQLYAYLKQHEKHAAQDRLIIERITPPTNDPLAFVLSDGRSWVQYVQGLTNQNQKIFAREKDVAGFGGHIARNCTQPKHPQIYDYFTSKDSAMRCVAFDSRCDDEPTAQSIFMANLSSAGPTNLQASSSDASILSEVPDLEKANVASNNDQVEHEIHSEVQHCASSALNTAYVLIDNNVHTPNEPSVTELAIYKEQVAIYEQHAKFELTKREQRMDDQMRILIQDRNRMEENVESKIWTQLGVQKSLVTEVRAMKAVFENMEAEVDHNAVDKKCGEIECRNLLIMNENLIAECLSIDVFYTAVISVCLNVSRFYEMHDALLLLKMYCSTLSPENLILRNKIQNDDHDLMIKHFSKLEVEHFNLQLKYQNLKERFGNKKPVTSSDAPSFDSLALFLYRTKDLTAKLNALHDLNERYRAENAKVKQHYKELYDSIKITRAKTTDQNKSLLSEIENLKAQLKDNSKCVTIPDSKPKVLAPGRYPIDVEPIPPRHKNNREVHLHYIKHLKENVETLREIVEDVKVERPIVFTSLASACRYIKL
ncbi:hypothetical protein Tco_0591145 [Tanacetum coccineum]